MIAVVDTGLSPLADLTQVIPGWDIVGNDTNTGDDFGHGTWVSSVIGATGDNGMGMAGYCWKCSIMPVRVAAGRTGALAPAVAAGIRWSVDHGARIINVSLASNGFDSNELGAVEYAVDHGVLVVGAAGNGGDTAPLYPGGYPGVSLSRALTRTMPSTAGRRTARGSRSPLPAAARCSMRPWGLPTPVAPRSRRPSCRASPGSSCRSTRA